MKTATVPTTTRYHFGRTIRVLMLEHGISTLKELLELMEAKGHHFNRTTVDHWLYGRNRVDPAFAQAFLEVLPLTEEQQTRLARNFMLGQQKPLAGRF